MIAMAMGTMTAFAQGGTELRGRVTDERDASIAGAEVRLLSRIGGRVADDHRRYGVYAFKNVAAGEYILEVKTKGFAAFTSKGLRIEAGQSLTNDVRLSVEALSENVIVTPTGTAQRADEISKAVTVLDDESIEAKRELTLAESLRGTPGLRVQQQGSMGPLTSLRLRGQRHFDTRFFSMDYAFEIQPTSTVLPFVHY